MNDILIEGISFNQYVFDFDAVFACKESCTAFFQFQKHCDFNSEAVMFVQEVNDLESMNKDSVEAIRIALHIFETYVQPTASQSTQKKSLCTFFKQISDDTQVWPVSNKEKTHTFTSPAKAFEALKHATLLELKTDSFPRFLRSKYWLQFAKSKDGAFLKKLGVPRAATLIAHYTVQDFELPIVADIDFQFSDQLSQDSYMWDYKGNHVTHVKSAEATSSMNAFFSDANILPKVPWSAKASLSKLTCVLPYDFDFVCQACCSWEAICQYDGNAYAFEDLSYMSNAELTTRYPSACSNNYRSVSTTILYFKLPFPMNQIRRYVSANAVEYNPAKEQLTLANRFVMNKDIPPLKTGHIEAFDFVSWVFTKLGDNRTMVHQCHYINLGGYGTNKTFLKLATFARCKDYQKSMVKYLKKEFEKPTPKKDFVAKNYQDACVAARRAAYQQKHPNNSPMPLQQ